MVDKSPKNIVASCTVLSIYNPNLLPLSSIPTYHNVVSEEVVVALVLGVPSLLVAAISLWITYLTYSHSRSPPSPPVSRIPSWPAAQYPVPLSHDTWPSSESSVHGANTPVNVRWAAATASCVSRSQFTRGFMETWDHQVPWGFEMHTP
ncbi:hypothetical protein PG996_008888 [Apiospora saccharicola]|uniref:Uncharacterized protein n=1 Tax=Apiospora saccharicola TaxID=335842 RepID=A0ABR1V1R6_9PEZI